MWRASMKAVLTWLPAVLVALSAALAGGCGGDSGAEVAWDPMVVEIALPTVTAALAAGDPQRALAELERLATPGPLPPGASHLRALALADLGRDREAQDAWNAELELHPGNGRGHALLAQLLLSQGHLDAAAGHLEQALRFAPRDPIVALIAGRAALLRDDDETAQRRFRDYLSADPYSRQAAEAHHALAQIDARRGPDAAQQAQLHEQTATALNKLHDYLSSYQRRVMDDPSDTEAAYGVATAYLNLYVSMGRDPRLRNQAEQALLHVLTLAPEESRALYNLGFIRTEELRWNEAQDCFERSLRSDPEYEPARINLGMLLVRMDRRADGIAELERVVSIAGSTEGVARARAELVSILEASAVPAERERAIAHCRALIELLPDDPLGAQAHLDRLLAPEPTTAPTQPAGAAEPADSR